MFTPELLQRLLDTSVGLAAVFLGVATLLAAARLTLGPTLPDRALALDLLGFIAVALAAVIVLRTGETVLFDSAMALALVAFLATIGLAHFHAEEPPSEPGSNVEEDPEEADAGIRDVSDSGMLSGGSGGGSGG